jgi:hypothetical protein
MTKKILTSLVAAAALTSSVMAYETSELAQITDKNNSVENYANTTSVVNNAAGQVSLSTKTTSNTLLFPAFFASTGWESTLRVINTSSTTAVVAKVVFYDGKDSHELKDFNIYLSANDEWMGNVKIVNGQATITSTDDSAPITASVARGAYPMATATDPMTAVLGSSSGYVQVIGMVAADDNISSTLAPFNDTAHAGLTKAYHAKHSLLREDYTMFSKAARLGSTSATPIFKDGVVQDGLSNYPYMDINESNSSFDSIAALAPLTGDVRITNTTTGTDMVMPAINLDYNTTATGGDSTGKALVYLEGEKANVVDTDINNSTTGLYDLASITADINHIASNKAYMTYGDAAINNNYVLFTGMFKRTVAQLTTPVSTTDLLTTVTSDYYNDADLRDTANPNYGSVSLTASVYDMSENSMSAGQFSPATTPTIMFKNELDTTGTDVTDSTKLPYYLDQASASGFTKGFVVLQNSSSTKNIPGILTQMIATTAGSTTVTNWIRPTTIK